MNYLQPHYNRCHDPERKYVPLKVSLGGKFGDAFTICYDEEMGKKHQVPPHFHVKSETAEVCIKFDRAEYFLDGVNYDFLTSEQMRILDEKLRLTMEFDPYYPVIESYWDFMHHAWNQIGYDMRPSVRYCQPDYTNIRIPERLKENLR